MIQNDRRIISPHGNVKTLTSLSVGGDRRLNSDATTKTTPTKVVPAAARTMNCIVERRGPQQQPVFGWE